jgi:exodeoxyribonuclease VII small subunit
MKMNLSFDDAYNELKSLVEQIEDSKIQVDTLAEKVAQANELIKYCEGKLRAIEEQINENNKEA